MEDPKAVHLFTAVAYSGKKKAGSWGAVLRFGDSEKGMSERVDGASAWRVFRTITLPLLLVSTAPLLIGSFAFKLHQILGHASRYEFSLLSFLSNASMICGINSSALLA